MDDTTKTKMFLSEECNNSRGNNQPTEYDMCVKPLLLFMRVKLLFFFDRNKSPANFLFKEQNRGANFSQNEVIFIVFIQN
eukprot:UN21010